MDLSLPGTYGPDDPGGGPLIPTLGIRKWYNDISQAPSKQTQVTDLTWDDVLSNWMLTCLDFQSRGMDLEALQHSRSWSWFTTRCVWIMGQPDSFLHHIIARKKTEDA